VRSILLDAGPLIALFYRRGKDHKHYDDLISNYADAGLRLLTTWPCVVETTHLLGVSERYEVLNWIVLGGVLVYPFSSENLVEITESMRAYTEAGKAEMDFADATLYWLASETRVSEVMTLDRRDFSRVVLLDGTVVFAILQLKSCHPP